MKVRGGRGRSALYVGCVHMLTDSIYKCCCCGCWLREA